MKSWVKLLVKIDRVSRLDKFYRWPHFFSHYSSTGLHREIELLLHDDSNVLPRPLNMDIRSSSNTGNIIHNWKPSQITQTRKLTFLPHSANESLLVDWERPFTFVISLQWTDAHPTQQWARIQRSFFSFFCSFVDCFSWWAERIRNLFSFHFKASWNEVQSNQSKEQASDNGCGCQRTSVYAGSSLLDKCRKALNSVITTEQKPVCGCSVETWSARRRRKTTSSTTIWAIHFGRASHVCRVLALVKIVDRNLARSAESFCCFHWACAVVVDLANLDDVCTFRYKPKEKKTWQ